MKKYFKITVFTLIGIMISLFIITLFNYINIISGIGLTIFKLIIPIVSIFIGSIFIGKNSIKKGWLSGIKFGTIFVILFLILNLIFKNNFNIKLIIYYILIIPISILGSAFGINKNSTK